MRYVLNGGFQQKGGIPLASQGKPTRRVPRLGLRWLVLGDNQTFATAPGAKRIMFDAGGSFFEHAMLFFTSAYEQRGLPFDESFESDNQAIVVFCSFFSGLLKLSEVSEICVDIKFHFNRGSLNGPNSNDTMFCVEGKREVDLLGPFGCPIFAFKPQRLRDIFPLAVRIYVWETNGQVNQVNYWQNIPPDWKAKYQPRTTFYDRPPCRVASFCFFCFEGFPSNLNPPRKGANVSQWPLKF